MAMADDQFVAWFRAASPYIHVHRGKTFIVHIDNVLLDDGAAGFTNLVHDLALLSSLGIRLIMVYGTRRHIDLRLQAAGISAAFHRGKRLTDAASMGHVKAAAGRLLLAIQAKLSMGLGNTPMSNAGLRVASGNYISARPMGIIDGIDHEFTGMVRHIDTAAIAAQLRDNVIVLLPPLGYSVTGEAYNLAADALAAELAVAMKADKLIYLADAAVLAPLLDGKRHDNLTRTLAAERLAALPKDGAAHHYLHLAITACDAGIVRTHLLDRNEDGALLRELFSKDGSGVMLTASSYDVLRQADSADIAGILELITPLEQRGYLVVRSREKLELEIGNFWVLSRDGVIIACVALYVYGEYAELACLAVSPAYQGGGRGAQLLDTVAGQARQRRARKLFVLTTQAVHWFLERGFVEAGLDVLPLEKQAMYNYQRNSRALVKAL